MPKTIPCWDCKGKGKKKIYPEWMQTGYEYIGCETCKGGGVLSVYTQAEVQKLRDAIEFVISTQQNFYGNATELHIAMSDIVVGLKKVLKDGE